MGSEAPSPHRLSQADRSALSERRTLEAAVALMGERGYEKTTLAAIGEAAGYSRGLATHLFGSKADLFAQVIRWISEKLRRQVEPALAGRGGADADAYAEAIEFCGTLFGLGLQWLIDPTGFQTKDMHRRFKERLEATLRP